MGKLLLIGRRPKLRLSSSPTCLYSARERGSPSEITVFVRISYGKVVGNWSLTKMAIQFFPYIPIQCT